LNRVSDRSTEKIRKRIFSEHNPELQKSIDRETVSYKEDKIKAKPIIEEKKSKTRKVTVFEVCRYSPFEFWFIIKVCEWISLISIAINLKVVE